ncbi:hypothetical protein LUZ60_002095 [Juncus effusus]|nr:hypothetical protein LUZ60_002095 [Juncus effusus]
MFFGESSWKMKNSACSNLQTDPSNKRMFFCNLLPTAILLSLVLFLATFFLTLGSNENFSIWRTEKSEEMDNSDLQTGPLDNLQTSRQENLQTSPQENLQTSPPDNLQISPPDKCKTGCKPVGSEPLPKGIVVETTDLEMEPLLGSLPKKEIRKGSKSLLAIPVGIKQKDLVNKIISKFYSPHFTVMLFHYDGIVNAWRDLKWSDHVLHVSAMNQTKWWFAKRFLHPDIVAEYDYIFLWDEDLGVEHFDPSRYLSIVKREGLEISQPGLDPKSPIHHKITARRRKGYVHRRFIKTTGGGRCYENSTSPPCTGWVEMMAPVFSKSAWRCVWHMIQNDLIYAWGLDYKLGYCAQGDRTLNVGVVDSEYVFHKAIPSLGGDDKKVASKYSDRIVVRQRSYAELQQFDKRWKKATENDECWTDLYRENNTA